MGTMPDWRKRWPRDIPIESDFVPVLIRPVDVMSAAMLGTPQRKRLRGK
jgi:hypothetical protein